MTRTAESICAVEHDDQYTGYRCPYTNEPVFYRVTIEALATPENPGTPRAWRVTGCQLRGIRPRGRKTAPLHVYSIDEARSVAKTLYHRHIRYIERTFGQGQLRQAVHEEDRGVFDYEH